MKRAIAESDGNEVLFVASLDGDGMIDTVTIPAHGHRTAVAAPPMHTERGDVVIHNHPSGVLTPSEADVQVAARLAAGGIGSFIVDNEVERLVVVVEPARRRALQPLEIDTLCEVLGPGGTLSRIHPGYEPRDSQVQMLSAVAESFNESQIAVIEAGTGTGKSFAYLIPALAWAASNEERVVISTATITLQQQLIEKDIPEVQKILGTNEKAVLVKGRGNYLCPLRLSEAIDEEGLLGAGRDSLIALRKWSDETPTGSKSELPVPVGESVWSRVNSDPDACTGMRCRQQANCFVMRARREAAAARILVANHHLLFADLALRIRGVGFDQAAVLPPFQRLVIDEAHTMEQSATSYFSHAFSRHSIARSCARLYRSTGTRSFGLSILLEQLAANQWGELPAMIDAVHAAAGVLNAVALSGEGSSRRLPMDVETETRARLNREMDELRSRILLLIDYVSVRIRALSEDDRDRPEVHETRQIVRRLQEVATLCERIAHCEDDSKTVYWLDRRPGGGDPFVRFVGTPVEIGPVLAEAVYEPFETVVCTSATLSVDGSFSYWAERVGLDATDSKRVRFASLPSPFRFDRQVLLAAPTDAPSPESSAYLTFLTRFVTEVLELSEGSGLVLFTSYGMLDAVYAEVHPKLLAAGITVLRQGDDDRSRLLRAFNDETSSVLFATDSFWEGVDAPGQTLRVVVICRLPFRVPTDPVLRARMDLLTTRGESAFARLSLPEAIIRLKQGFGRLMRRADDRGVVIVTDSRIVSKPYGALFVSSLPQTAQSIKSSQAILEDIERFLW